MTDLPFDGLRTEGARLIGPNALIQTAAALDELESGSVEAILLDSERFGPLGVEVIDLRVQVGLKGVATD